MIVCGYCGAPVKDHPVDGIATCRYCGTMNEVRAGARTRTQMPAPSSRARGSRQKLALPIAIAVSLFGLVAVGGVLLAAKDTGARGGVLHLSERSCFVDIDGDGIHDVIGVGGKFGGTKYPLFGIDGMSGDALWESEHAGEAAADTLYCGSEDTVLLSSPGFLLRAFDTSNGLARWQRRLGDEVDGVEASDADDCIAVRTQDGSHTLLSLANGDPMPDCDAPEPTSRVQREERWQDRIRRASIAGTTIVAAGRDSGTPMLVLEARSQDGGEPLWSRELDVRALGDWGLTAFLAPLGDRLLVVARALPGDRLVLLTLDPRSGEELARLEETEEQAAYHSASDFRAAYAGTNIVLIHSYNSVHAYDPQTLELRWRLGPR